MNTSTLLIPGRIPPDSDAALPEDKLPRPKPDKSIAVPDYDVLSEGCDPSSLTSQPSVISPPSSTDAFAALVARLVAAENVWLDAKCITRSAKKQFDAIRREYDAAVRAASPSVPSVPSVLSVPSSPRV